MSAVKLDRAYIWSKAIPLSQAYWHFAQAEDRDRYRELTEATSTRSILRRFEEHQQQASQVTGPTLETAGNSPLSKLLGPVEDQKALEERLKANCLRYVREGNLHAFGYAAPRRPDDHPIEVPNDLWTHPVYWRNDTLIGDGLEMVAVRLIPAKWILQLQEISPQKPARRQGRPSREHQILEAWNTLLANGEIDFKAHKIDAYRKVREEVMKRQPDQGETGLGNDALRKTLAERWDQSRAEKL